MTTVTWTEAFCGVKVRPGAVDPAMGWTALLTPISCSIELVSGARATQEYKSTERSKSA